MLETSGVGLCAERNVVDAVAAVARRAASGRLPVQRRLHRPGQQRHASAGIVSPKGGLVIGPFSGTEFYVNAGLGFHSNDARGTTITRDPSTGERRRTGDAAGTRRPDPKSACGPWPCHTCKAASRCGRFHLDSELIFVGDAGTTEAGRPSHRYGIEFANYYSPRPWLIFDGDLSWSRAHVHG